MTLQNMGTILPVVRDGRLRGLAVTSLKRTSVMPDLPTVAESGFAGLRSDLLVRADGAGRHAGADHRQGPSAGGGGRGHAGRAREACALGLDTSADGPDAVAAIIKADTAKWAKVIKDANIKAGE